MALFTKNLGLKVWNNQSDKYNYQELARNWLKVDDHDHSSGNGKQIPSDGIADGSISIRKLERGVIDQITKQINIDVVQSVNTARIVDKSVTSSKLSPYAKLPLGSIVPWFWPTTPNQTNLDSAMGVASDKPSAWRICDGSTLDGTNEKHDFGGSVTLPDLRDRFVQGASGSAGTTNPVNGTGGKDKLDLGHVHRFDHVHKIPGHTHTASHVSMPDHTHGDPSNQQFIVKDSGNKYFYDNSPPNTQKTTQFDSRTTTGTVVGGAKAVLGYVGSVANGATPDANGLYSGDTGNLLTGSPNGGLDTQQPTGLANGVDINVIDNRPPYVSLTYIIKVLNDA